MKPIFDDDPTQRLLIIGVLGNTSEHFAEHRETMANNTLPKSKAELMSEIEHEWSALMDVVAQLSPEQMLMPDAGGWSPKDNLAHITECMNILLGYYFDHRPSHEVMGVAPEVTADWDIEVMNEVMFERDRDQPVEQVLDELKAMYARVHERLEATTFEDLMKPIFDVDSIKRPLIKGVIGNTSEHFAEHRETIAKMLKA